MFLSVLSAGRVRAVIASLFARAALRKRLSIGGGTLSVDVVLGDAAYQAQLTRTKGSINIPLFH
jgi:hypothetical protein